MHVYDFVSTKITEPQVRSIISKARYDPGDYTYEARVDGDGYVVRGDEPMAISRLEHAARQLHITVEISSPPATADLAATVYHCDFENATKDTWTFCVYQEFPGSPGLDSVSWKQTTVPQSGESGVEWVIDYLVGIVNYKQSGGKGVYKASQKLGTQLGQKWDTRMESGAQQLFEAGSAPQKNQLLIDNSSGLLANLAVGMDGDIAVVRSNVYSGNAAQFTVEPIYWVALYKDLVKGEVISGNQIHGPLPVKFAGGATSLVFRAYIDGQTFVFEQEGTSNRSTAPLTEMQARIAAVSRPDRALRSPRLAATS
ncbi:hypothetical protein [Frigoriglobus tundricola]|uniref:Uncharacterized protein n=1 Tax=Frigoriglobus tundricola TaxID=2774151 RepID=A0A6M5YXT9_9BACT|nr:hypothetical protein [Frigoriglobus tundricola]QJW98023.1 hypothetical protein FTUN_5603 [Frigoriglobus tundricola]